MTRGDRGIATVWSAALTILLLVVALTAMAVAAVVLVRAKAATVADLAAVAAVQGSGCEAAEGVAQANGLALASCDRENADVIVRVDAPAPPALRQLLAWLGRGEPTLSAWARAGPGQ